MVRVLVGSDVCPIGRNEQLFAEGDAASVFNDILAEFQQADLSIVNLECSLIQQQSPIQKAGPVLGVKASCINGMKNTGIDVVNLGNNHITDHGSAGLKSTLQACEDAGIACVGAGENLEDAGKILVREIAGMRIGIYSAAEHEFSIAAKQTPGANPLDVIDFVRKVKGWRKRCDYLIVLLHAGVEHYPYPSPALRKMCRFFVEQGANAVICQHSHCPGCYENYGNGHIVYGQGNLIFDMPSKARKYKFWNEGFLVVLQIEGPDSSVMEIIPHIQSESGLGTQRMTGKEEEIFRQTLEQKSLAILEDGFVEKQWDQFCRENKNAYLSSLFGHGLLLHKLNTKTGLVSCLISKRRLRRKLNAIRCQSHREAIIKILSEE